MACIRRALNSENSQHAGHRIRKTANMRGTEFRKQPTCGLPPHDGRPACGMSPHDGRTPPGMWLHAWGPAPGMWLHAAGNRGGMRAHAVGIVSGMRAYAVEIVSGMRAYAVEIVSGIRAHALGTRTACGHMPWTQERHGIACGGDGCQQKWQPVTQRVYCSSGRRLIYPCCSAESVEPCQRLGTDHLHARTHRRHIYHYRK